MAPRYSSLAAALVLAAASAALAQPPAPAQQPAPAAIAAPASFTVFVSGAAVGTEEVTVSSSQDGWTIHTSSRIGVPINLSNSRLEVRYDRDWKPLSLEIDASLRGVPLLLRTVFANGKAASKITQGGQQSQKVDDVAVDALVLPNMFFGAYEALALRLRSVNPGGQIRAYIAPQVEIAVSLNSVSDERIKTPARVIALKRYSIVFVNPSGPMAAEVWADEDSRLVRFRMPAQGLEVARDDVATVSSRVERMARPTDEQVRIQASGFSLAATVSKPTTTASAPRLPAVVLVPGAGPVDRDETVAGISIFAQLASAIADAGFMVVRFDKRGIGQSGGRDESASISDFADDVRAVLNYLEKRKDVDPARLVIVGHSEGGFVGLVAASEEKKLAGLVLIGTPGTTGNELVLEQQRHLLDRMDLPETEKQRRMDLQKQIHGAVISGSGWEAVPQGFRKQADSPWFRSYLTFDPAKQMKKVQQPLLVLQGSLDRQVAARNGQLLADMAKARRNDSGTRFVMVEGINHLLVPATTGEVDEYQALADKAISPALIASLTAWLKDTLHVDTAGQRR